MASVLLPSNGVQFLAAERSEIRQGHARGRAARQAGVSLVYEIARSCGYRRPKLVGGGRRRRQVVVTEASMSLSQCCGSLGTATAPFEARNVDRSLHGDRPIRYAHLHGGIVGIFMVSCGIEAVSLRVVALEVFLNSGLVYRPRDVLAPRIVEGLGK